jgi:hypothetical protein
VRRPRALLAAAALTGLAAVSAPAAAQPPATPALLEGSFAMTGHVTVAVDVRGERAGQAIARTWSFAPTCPSSPCPTVTLTRQRAGGSDRVRLRLTAPGLYTGTGRFYRPLRCAGRTARPGERIPYRIGVRVTATTVTSAGVKVVRAIRASYVNVRRINLTRCVAFLGHDAARYTGTLSS